MEKPAFVAKYGAAGLIFATFVAGIWIQFFTVPSGDLAGLVWEARQLIDGGWVLYRDIFEPNPPLIIWLYAPFVALAEYFAWEPVTTLKMGTAILVGVSVTLCYLVLRRSGLFGPKERESFVVALCGLLLLAPDSFLTFAQREHLLVVLLLPYALLRLPSVDARPVPLPLQAVIGAMAGIGLCIKPHFFIIWLAILGFRFAMNRSLRALVQLPECLIAAVAFIYLACVIVFMPQYFQWLPIALETYRYHVYPGETTADTIEAFAAVAALALILAWFFRLFRDARPYKRDMAYLLCLAAAAYLEALLQFKLWAYIFYPLIAFGMIAVIVQILLRPVTTIWAVVAMAWLFFPLTPLSDDRQDWDRDVYRQWMQALIPYQQEDTFFYIGLAISPPQFLSREHTLRWSNPIGQLDLLLDGIMTFSPDTDQPTLVPRPGKEALERWLLDKIAGNLQRAHPDVIAIEQRWWDTAKPKDHYFNFLAWFKQDPAITRYLQRYTHVTDIDVCVSVLKKKPCNSINVYAIYVLKSTHPGINKPHPITSQQH